MRIMPVGMIDNSWSTGNQSFTFWTNGNISNWFFHEALNRFHIVSGRSRQFVVVADRSHPGTSVYTGCAPMSSAVIGK